MLAFAGNSLLCRAALKHTAIDATSFTSVRLISGALALWLLLRWRDAAARSGGSWGSAAALFAYAALLSYAYIGLDTGVGALLLFGAVQTTMIGTALRRGERLHIQQTLGLLLAVAGLIGLVLPGLTRPPLGHAALMLASGAAWGVYSLRARGTGDPTLATAGNFLRTVPMAVLLSSVMFRQVQFDPTGALYATVSGAITSGLGYALWYAALPGLRTTSAATVQLSVPVLASIGGIVLLGEALTPRLLLTSIAILGGIALVIRPRAKAAA
ncbi:DMT family transporter [Sinimarinibacterium sp. CAU 1509]|nr:DMT family transporter [Sinimarinibacterium sp. CAU 1509]